MSAYVCSLAEYKHTIHFQCIHIHNKEVDPEQEVAHILACAADISVNKLASEILAFVTEDIFDAHYFYLKVNLVCSPAKLPLFHFFLFFHLFVSPAKSFIIFFTESVHGLWRFYSSYPNWTQVHGIRNANMEPCVQRRLGHSGAWL